MSIFFFLNRNKKIIQAVVIYTRSLIQNEYVIFNEMVGCSSPHVEKDNERNSVTIFYLFCHYFVRICSRDGRTDGERGREGEGERSSDSRFCLCYESDVNFFSVYLSPYHLKFS